MKLTRTIKRENFGLSLPQTGVLSLDKNDLQDKTFVVEGIKTRNGAKEFNQAEDEGNQEQVNSLVVQLKSEDSSRVFNMSLRQFMSLPISEKDLSSEDIANKFVNSRPDASMSPLYSIYSDSAEDTIELPQKISFTHVQARKTPDDKHIMYPPSAYEKFNTRVSEARAAAEAAKTTFNILDIYQDYDFMSSLYTVAPVNAATIQPQKVVSINYIQ